MVRISKKRLSNRQKSPWIKEKHPLSLMLILFVWLPLVDTFRTANWRKIKSGLGFSGIFGLLPEMAVQNLQA